MEISRNRLTPGNCCKYAAWAIGMLALCGLLLSVWQSVKISYPASANLAPNSSKFEVAGVHAHAFSPAVQPNESRLQCPLRVALRSC